MINLFKLFRKSKQNSNQFVLPNYVYSNNFTYSWNTYDFESYIQYGYKANPYLFSAIQLICDTAKTVPVYAKQKNEEEYLPEEDPISQLIKRPYKMGYKKWLETMITYKLLGGQAFSLALSPDLQEDKPIKEVPFQLYPLSVSSMKANYGDKLGEILNFEYRLPTGSIKYPENDILYWRSIDPGNERQSMTPFKPLEKTIDINNASRNYNKAILDNGGNVGTVITTDNPSFNRNDAELIKKNYEDSYGGTNKAGKLLVLWGGLKVVKFGLTPQEMGYERLINLSAREIAIAFRIPPQMLGDTSTHTYNNYNEARKILYTECVLPLLGDLFDTFIVFIEQRTGREIEIVWDLDKIPALAEETTAFKNQVRADYQAGLITLNEARVYLGWDEVKDGDRFNDIYVAPEENKSLRRKKDYSKWLY